jgi:hypothetical protein
MSRAYFVFSYLSSCFSTKDSIKPAKLYAFASDLLWSFSSAKLRQSCATSCTFSASKNSFSFYASSNLVNTSATEWFPKWLSSAGRRRVGARRTICIRWKLPVLSVGRWREWWACWNRQALSPLAPPGIALSLTAPKLDIPSRPAPLRPLPRRGCRRSPRWTPLKGWIEFKWLNVWRFDRG